MDESNIDGFDRTAVSQRGGKRPAELDSGCPAKVIPAGKTFVDAGRSAFGRSLSDEQKKGIQETEEPERTR